MSRPITSCICLGTGRVREVWSGGHSCDLAPAHEGERNALPCPDCAAVKRADRAAAKALDAWQERDFSRVVPGLGALVTLALSSASGAGKVAA